MGLWTVIRRDKKITVWAVGLVLSAGLVFWANPALRGRATSVANTTSDKSNLIRLGLWHRSVEIIRDHPLRGVGPGNFLVKPAELRWGGSPPDKDWTETHNMYLQMAVERGLPGLAVFLWFLWAVGRALWRAARSDPAALGIFFGFVGLLLAGMTESWTNDSEVMMAFYFLAGSALALGRAGLQSNKMSERASS
jgi:O-antigen ligase